MHNSNVPTLRRSSRVPITVPVLVTSLDPGNNFSEVCETLVVSAHGCAMRAPIKLEAGIPLHFHSQEGRVTTAEVVYCQPLGPDRQSWRLGARFDRPGNFWSLQTCPKDWSRLPATVAGNIAPTVPATRILPPNQAMASAKIVLDRIKTPTLERASQGDACRTGSATRGRDGGPQGKARARRKAEPI